MKHLLINLHPKTSEEKALYFKNIISFINSTSPSEGERAIFDCLRKNSDIISQFETEARFGKKKSDFKITFVNGKIGYLEFNGSQHFYYSDRYYGMTKFDNPKDAIKAHVEQETSLINKQLNYFNQGDSCLNINCLYQLPSKILGKPKNKKQLLNKHKWESHYKFFKDLGANNNTTFRLLLEKMMNEHCLLNYNITDNIKRNIWGITSDIAVIYNKWVNDDRYTYNIETC